MKILIDQESIKQKIKELGKKITEDYKGKKPVFVGVLKGAFIFLADLVREVKIDVEFDFVVVSLYRGEKNPDVIILEREVLTELEGRDVILVDEILDTGRTFSFLIDHIKAKGAKSVKTCVFLKKKKKRRVEIEPDYCGFEIPDVFVVGYGLDYKERYRNLPYVGIVDE